MNFKQYWKSRQDKVERALERALPKATVKPATIHKAMRYSLFAGGKRLRPILVLAGCECVGGEVESAVSLACAVECIHTYSLIHDDLPCMDDDDLRRGKPTLHKVFGEAVAVLAGDGLLTVAFELVAGCKPAKRYGVAEYVKELARVSGSLGLIAGQVADLEGEGKRLGAKDLKFIHENKTAALIAGSLRLGAMCGNATEGQLKSVTAFGQALGLAFQVVDDILDVTQTSEQLGKSAGKDLKSEKSTYPALLGLEKAQKEAERLTAQAMSALKPLGKKADRLREIADVMLSRQS